MPLFRSRTAVQLARNARAFLYLDTGVVRGEAPPTLEAMEETQARLREQIEEARWALANRDHRISGLEKELGGHTVGAGNIAWIFGTVRTGSTWLASMMRDGENHAMWNEPRVGELFGSFYERAAHRRDNENFVMGTHRKLVWLKSVRDFVLDSAGARFPKFARDGLLVIKEPSGSIGAPILMEALPESAMVLLVRDPRDIVASALDAAREGSWAYELRGTKRRERRGLVGADDAPLDDFTGKSQEEVVEDQATMYLRYVGNSKRAFDAHDGRKVLVRYEDLLADTLGTMKRIYSELEIEVDGEDLARIVREHSWEMIPEEEKGEGKFYRKGASGAWREDLGPDQVKVVEEITGPLLREFYPDGTA
ncbi:MAG: sulfotransferase domain-containing protein [Rubrobacter sp.]|nr:sulfotransferase domain-containing protein [Rubrobacter sp.]